MIELFKNKYVFMLSSLVASGASYFLNVTLIFLLDDKSQYANYLSINAWAIYLSTFIYLSLIELYISPEGKSVEISSLLNSSFFTLLFCSFFTVALYSLVGYKYISFSVIFSAIFYAFIKLLTQYFLFCVKIEGVVLLRYGRSLLIAGSILILYLLKELGETVISSEGQLYIQGLMCALVAFCVITHMKISFSFNKDEILGVYKKFKGRIAKRNFSMIFDMIHMPIMYHVISKNSEFLNAAFVYAMGLVLPMAYVVSVILKEQVIIKLGGNGFNIVNKISKAMLFVVILSYFAIAFIYNQGDYYQIFSLLLLGLLITFSGCIGLNIYKKGLEKYDLTTNIFVMSLLLMISSAGIVDSPQTQVFLSIFVVSLKFSIQLLLALSGKEKVGAFQ